MEGQRPTSKKKTRAGGASLFYGGLLGLGSRQLPFGLDLLVVVRFGSIAEARNGIYTRETACVFLEGSSANQFQPAIFAARIGALSAYS